MKTYLFKIVMGDPYDDGHGKTSVIIVECNKPIAIVQKAYNQSKEKYPELCPENYCNEYDNPYLPYEKWHELRKKGFSLSQEDDKQIDKDKENPFINPEDFAKIILWFCALSDSALTFKIIDLPILDGDSNFGYGLFY